MIDNMTESLMMLTEKNPTCKKLKSFRSIVGKKKDKVANKTATLTEKITVTYIFFKIRIISIYKYVYKCATVI